MTSNKNTTNTQMPKKANPSPLPSEDPKLMIKASSRKPIQKEYAPVEKLSKRESEPKALGLSPIGCVFVIGLLVALYFLIQYFLK